MILSLIVAMGKNQEIGLNNQLLWRLPNDLKKFKQLTLSHTLIMGRKTFDSIGRPLPGRKTIVISRNQGLEIEGVRMAFSFEKALELIQNENEVFICGGGQIYQEALPFAQKIYLSRVAFEGEADTYFPKVDWDEWEVENEEDYSTDQPAWKFFEMRRK